MELRHGIPEDELKSRRERLLEQVRGAGLAGYVLFDQHFIRYFTGFGFLSTERPVVYAQSAGGEMMVFVPEFEVERVRAETSFERIESYPEYPGIEHPMRILARVLTDMGIAGSIGADQDGYPGILGYQGPALSETTSSTVAPLSAPIEGMMVRKSDNELALIRESARWCAHAHRLLQEFTRPGATEAEASLRDEVRRLFGHAVAAQQVAFGGLRPGVTCADVDGAVMRYLEQHGLLANWRQHTGHAIGLRNHEAPFLDLGDHTTIEAGMVFTIEPGVYADDIGGFRHSDTVAVTPDGIDILTDYPSDLESLTILA
jgi:Xaa-Pro aminopeptidase